jgi:hypothetical protein
MPEVTSHSFRKTDRLRLPTPRLVVTQVGSTQHAVVTATVADSDDVIG